MQHYTRNTTAISKRCPTCGKMTMHRVDDRRVGSCTEHGKPHLSKSQEKRAGRVEDTTGDLFEQRPRIK